jgi:chitin synthase
MAATNLAVSTGELADLVSQANTGVTVIPSDDAILAVLQARFRSDHPYTRISTSNLVVVNPYKALANTNDASAREYEERCYRDTSLSLVRGAPPLQPHLFDMAARMYLLMRRRNESQSVVFRCVVVSFNYTIYSFSPSFVSQRNHRLR